MKVWLVRLAFLGAMGAVGFWAWHLFFPSPEQIIHKRLSELARTASIVANEGPLTILAKTEKLASLFSTDAQISVDVAGRPFQTFNGREEIRRAAMGARSMLNTLKVEFFDVIVTGGADQQSARAHLTATANLPGEKLPEVEELEIGFKIIDHEWLITRVETVKTLR